MDNFLSPLVGYDTITLHPKDSQVFGDTVKSLSNQYGYDFLIQNVPATCIMIDGMSVGDPHTITYVNYINLLEEYAPNNVEYAEVYSSAI